MLSEKPCIVLRIPQRCVHHINTKIWTQNSVKLMIFKRITDNVTVAQIFLGLYQLTEWSCVENMKASVKSWYFWGHA